MWIANFNNQNLKGAYYAGRFGTVVVALEPWWSEIDTGNGISLKLYMYVTQQKFF